MADAGIVVLVALLSDSTWALASGTVTGRIKTGYLVGAEREDIATVGGASPGALLVGRTRVYVANATNDTISVIDASNGTILKEIPLSVPGLERFLPTR